MKQYNAEKITGSHWGRIVLLLVFVFFFPLSGCGWQNASYQEPAEEAVPEDAVRLYVMNEERTKVVTEEFVLSGDSVDMQVAEFLTILENRLWTAEERNRMMDNNPIYEYKIDETGLLTLRLSADYTVTSSITEVLRRASLVKTLCQLEGIAAVEFYIGSQPMLTSAGKPVGMLTAKDFIDSTGENTEFYQEAKVLVYFSGLLGDALTEANLKIVYDGTMATERLILQQLLEGPISDDMLPVIPKGTVLNKVTIRDGICYVDFNEKFMEKRDGITAEVAIYSIVNSLTELSNVYKVQFLINGSVRKYYQNLDFSQPFERNLEIVEGEQ